MTRTLLAFFFALALWLPYSKAQLISYELIDNYTKTEIRSLANAFFVPPGLLSYNYDIDAYKVLYKTVDPLGDTVQASGVFMVPINTTCGLPTATYQHGSTSKKDNVPSRENAEFFIGLFYATNGFFMAQPDFIGLGDSPGLHPYVHSESQAQAVVDLLRVGKEIAATEDENQNNQLYLFGYSQGGHATMAAVKEIEEKYANEFQITASNPMAGPYDLAGIQSNVIIDDVEYSTPAYLPYIMLAYNGIYDYLGFEMDEIFISPYDTLLPPLFDGTMELGEISELMPAIPNRVLQPALLDSFKNNLDHPFRRALEDNELINGWTPASPMRLTHCMGDDQIAFQNSVIAKDSFEARGATGIEILDLGNSGHEDCARLALVSGLAYFNRFYEADNNILLNDTTIVNATNTSSMDGSISVQISGGSGDLMYLWSNGDTTAMISDLSSGEYTLTVSDPDACSATYTFTVGADISTSTQDLQASPLKVFPNPTRDLLNIQLPNPGLRSTIQLIDAQGRVVKRLENIRDANLEWSMRELAAGIYWLDLRQDKGHWMQKVVVW
ncbi:MAG: T9SS type A sorting domain-containing protein [Bacteroidota bacterium]